MSKVTPKDHGEFGQGSTENISECNNQQEFSMWCSYMVLTKSNPHMKPLENWIHNYEQIYENCENLFKVSPGLRYC